MPVASGTTWTGARVCETCRVLVVPDATGLVWIHPPALREKFSRDVCDDPRPGGPARGHALRYGRDKPRPGPPTLFAEIEGLRRPPGVPLTIGVDGAFKVVTDGRVRKVMSWGYLSTCGLYGMGTIPPSPGSVIGGERALQAELGAIWHALTRQVPDGPAGAPVRLVDIHPIEVLTDSLDAVQLVDAWQAGEEEMPKGYSTERPEGWQPTLVKLALLLNEFRDTVRVSWVRGHSGVPLNEGADALAKLARAWSIGRIDKDTVARDAREAVLAALVRHAATLD